MRASDHCPGRFRILPNSLSSGSISITPGFVAGIAIGAASPFLSGLDVLDEAGASVGIVTGEASSGSVSGGSGF